MKIVIFLVAAFMALSYQGFSQTRFNHTTGNVKDSITNTGIDTLTYTLTRSYQTISIQPVVTKATGTMAGTSILSLSVDGTNYVNTDTLTLANATTNSTIWTKSTAARYLRVITGGATTVTATVKAWITAVYQ